MTAENHSDCGDAAPVRRRICEVCGQEVDLTDPDQIFHHGPALHEPLV